MTAVKIDESPFYIAMSERDKLTSCRSVNLEDLAGRCWILFERRLHQPLYDTIMRRAESRGVRPSRVKHFTSPEEAFPSLADGSCGFSGKGGCSVGGSKSILKSDGMVECMEELEA